MTLAFGTCRDERGTFLAAREDGVIKEVPGYAGLDDLLAAGRPAWQDAITSAKRPRSGAPQLPFTVADYVDFYASEQHATNAGRILRPDSPGLPPNWKQLPIGYHGRAGTVINSGTAVRRPRGLRGPADFGPTQRLDFEAELGFVVGAGEPGGQVPPSAFAEHVFGVCLVNDWSARDVQRFETVPLGPFLGKSFATSISSWVVPLSELPRVAPAPRPVPSYLEEDEPWAIDVRLAVTINGAEVAGELPVRDLYWTGAQMLAHMTVNGAALRTGDLYASGTVSGPGQRQQGCLVEVSWGGAHPVAVGDGQRNWLEDGDEVTISCAELDLEVSGRIVT